MPEGAYMPNRVKVYVGSKIIKAYPMSFNEWALYKARRDGQENVAVRESDIPGYHVEYPPDGYESWSPKDQFETAYREITSGEAAMIG